MKYFTTASFCLLILIGLTSLSTESKEHPQTNDINNESKTDPMKLGAFSISLSVKDLAKSKEFYESLGFSQLGGDLSMNYLIMKNENSLIGLFQGMFEGNILTFNPGWDESGKNIDEFMDVREIQQSLLEQGLALDSMVEENSEGPGNFIMKDPDGNVIFLDQHR